MKVINYFSVLMLLLSAFVISCGQSNPKPDKDIYAKGYEAGRQDEEDAYRRRKEEDARRATLDRQERLRRKADEVMRQ